MATRAASLFAGFVQNRLSTTAERLTAVASAVFKFEPFDPGKIYVGPDQVCRGMLIDEVKRAVSAKSFWQLGPGKEHWDVSSSDIGRQVLRGGDPNLLSWTPSAETASLYGANRYWLPRDGAIVVASKPAVFTDISEQARFCPQLCAEEMQKCMMNIVISGGEVPDLAKLAAECNEICAVVGRQGGVKFTDSCTLDFVKEIHHVVGTGRSRFNLIPVALCQVEKFENPFYQDRAMAIKIVLANDPELLEILESTMRLEGSLKKGQRLLTPRDAAVIMQSELRALTQKGIRDAGIESTFTLTDIPVEAKSPEEIIDSVREKVAGIGVDVSRVGDKAVPKSGPGLG